MDFAKINFNFQYKMYLHIICSIFVAKHEMKDMHPPKNRNIITKALLVKTDFSVPM